MVQNDLSGALLALEALVARLRGPGGCPWDAQQTEATVKAYLLEEAYEAVDAIEQGSPTDICSELGDLLFQILFLVDIFKGKGEFTLQEVIEKIQKKMIHRHPHIFGPTKVSGAEEVAENWQKLKEEEAGTEKKTSSLLKSLPANLPALMRAHRMNERVYRMGLGLSEEETRAKMAEAWKTLSLALDQGDKDPIGETMGDILFTLSGLARHRGLDAEHLLREKNRKFLQKLEEDEKKEVGG